MVPFSSKCFTLSAKPCLGYAWYGHAQFRGGRSSRGGRLNLYYSLIFLIWQGKERNPSSHVSWDLLQVSYKEQMKKIGMLLDIATLTLMTYSPSCLLFQLSPLFLPPWLCSPKDPVNTCSLLSGALWCCKYLSRLRPITPLCSCGNQPVPQWGTHELVSAFSPLQPGCGKGPPICHGTGGTGLGGRKS